MRRDRAADDKATQGPATIYDVARLAGVSHQTVSRVLNGSPNLREATRLRVEAAMATLNYLPNRAARSLAVSNNFRIGALVTEILQSGPLRVVNGMATAAREHGYVVEMVTFDPQDDRSVEQAVAAMNASDLAGVFIAAPTDLVMERVQASRLRAPYVIQTDTELTSRTARLDEASYSLVVRHVLGLGHRRIFHVAGPHDWVAARNRAAVLSAVAEQAGAEVLASVEGDWSAASGYRIGREIPSDEITAVVAANDQMALGVLRAFAERGVDVPGDVTVTGYDDIPEAEFYYPPLTTVRQDFEALGRSGFLDLLESLGLSSMRRAPLVGELRVRASSGPARPVSTLDRA